MAKKVKLISVRMLGVNCGNAAPDSAGVDALNWIASNAVKPAVVNMSWTFDDAAIGDAALKAVDGAGITMVSASGNSSADACNTGPGPRLPAIINLGSTGSNDSRSSFSNYGRCLDLFAPGGNIYSATSSSTSSYGSMSGTSMASPHAAGAVALYLQGNPNATPAQAQDFIVSNATADVVGNAGSGSPTKLLYTLAGDPPPPPGNDFSMSLSPESGTVRSGESISSTVGTAVVNGSAETISLSASGLPSGAAASFDPSSVTAGGSSTLTLSTTSSVATGSYEVTVTGKAASATHSVVFTLNVKQVDEPPPPSDGVVNGGFETGNLNGWTATGTTGMTSPGRTGSHAAKIGGGSSNATSSISQTFTVPTGKSSLVLYARQPAAPRSPTTEC